MRIGDWVMAIGNPFGLGGTVTTGIVSARGRDINSGPYDNFIQTDAAINRGNSGGPLFDENGLVIGVNTAIISPTGGSIGIGFAVPANLVKTVIAQLIEFGETRRGWLGVRIQPVTDDIAESLDMAEAKGALVAGVIKGGPVDDGSILPGDVIIRFDGKDVEDMRDLPRIVAESPVGKKVEVIIIRKGEERIIAVTLGRLEDGEQLIAGAEEAETPEVLTVLGLELAELDDALREQYGIDKSVEGVVITSIEPESAAAEKNITEGQVIVEVAQEIVTTPAEVKERVDKLKEDGRRNALLMIANKSGDYQFVHGPHALISGLIRRSGVRLPGLPLIRGDGVENVVFQLRMRVGNTRMIEIAGGVGNHPDPLHHSRGAVVVPNRKGDDLVKTTLFKAELQHPFGGLGGVSLAPITGCKTPSDFYRVGR